MTEEEKQLVFARLCQMQERIDEFEKTQNGLIKRLQGYVLGDQSNAEDSK